MIIQDPPRTIYLAVLATVLMMLLLLTGGCVSITYEAEQGRENLQVKTLFKSLDGLWSERDETGFSIIIDKTYTHDPMRGISELISTVDSLYGMGLRYEPDGRGPLLMDGRDDQ